MTGQAEQETRRAWRWRDCQEEIAAVLPREQPRDPRVGQGWFDEKTSCICIWNGAEWVCIPTD